MFIIIKQPKAVLRSNQQTFYVLLNEFLQFGFNVALCCVVFVTAAVDKSNNATNDTRKKNKQRHT